MRPTALTSKQTTNAPVKASPSHWWFFRNPKQRTRGAMVSIGDGVHLSRLRSILSFNSLMAALTLWPRIFSSAQIVFKWLHFVKLLAPLIALVSV